MRYIIPFLFSVILPGMNLSAQNTWFRIYNFNNNHNQITDRIIEWNQEYYMLLFACCPPEGDVNQNRIVKFDQQGNILWETRIQYPPSAMPEVYLNFPCDMKVAKDGSTYIYARPTQDSFMLNKIDRHGRVLWYKMYGGEPTGMGGTYRGLELTEDSLGLYITARTFEPKPKYLNYRVDSAGNTIWYNALSVPTFKNKGHVGLATPLVRLPDNTLVGAYDNDFVSDYQDHFLRMDSLGRLLKYVPSTRPARTRDMALHPNGNVVYMSEATNVVIGEPGGIRTQMLTPELDTVWTHLFYDYEYPILLNVNVFAKNVSVHPSGKILVSGSSHAHFVHLVCLSEQGKLLWFREVGVTEPEPNLTISRFGEAIWTSDGGILVNGESYGGTINGVKKYITFLIKLDSVGCLTPGCKDTRITAVADPAQTVEELSISPNPTHHQALVAWGSPARQDWTLAAYDVLGRERGLWSLHQGDSQVEIDAKALDEGIYLIRLTAKGHTLGTGKLVVKK